jgi:prolyl-tRNA editing enzyme YbaK/EbsC (Cys-tRNA(Pro) deacylase)
VYYVDERPVCAVLPSASIVNLDRLRELAGGGVVRSATEEELRGRWTGFDATSPLDVSRDQPMFVDVSLAAETTIVFDGGTDVGVIAMRWADFARSVKPIVGTFAESRLDRVGAFRLSYRE